MTVVVSKGVGVTVPTLGDVSFHAAEQALLTAGLNVTTGRIPRARTTG